MSTSTPRTTGWPGSPSAPDCDLRRVSDLIEILIAARLADAED